MRLMEYLTEFLKLIGLVLQSNKVSLFITSALVAASTLLAIEFFIDPKLFSAWPLVRLIVFMVAVSAFCFLATKVCQWFCLSFLRWTKNCHKAWKIQNLTKDQAQFLKIMSEQPSTAFLIESAVDWYDLRHLQRVQARQIASELSALGLLQLTGPNFNQALLTNEGIKCASKLCKPLNTSNPR